MKNISFENISKVALIGYIILFLASEGSGIGLLVNAYGSFIVLEIIGFTLIIAGLFPLFKILDMIILSKSSEERVFSGKPKDNTPSIFSTEKIDDADITARQQLSNRNRY